jgi:hypothetical protein
MTKQEVIEALDAFGDALNYAYGHLGKDDIQAAILSIEEAIDKWPPSQLADAADDQLICPMLFKERMESGEDKAFLCPYFHRWSNC